VTVREALAQARLAPTDAQVLLAHVLGVGRAWLAAHATDALPPASIERFGALARRRRDGEPVAYLVGSREFWGLPFAVDPSVLIPRPETETLVACALQRLPRERPVRVLDLGTGSGAIALALAHERPDADIVATDCSAEALAVARANAQRMKLANVRWLQSDWYRQLADRDGRFDLIASNPPYVAAADPHLREGDVRFEPQCALRAGADGLDALRVIVAGARERLVAGGHLVVEHGYDQAEAVRELLRAAGFTALESRRDLAGIRRVAAGTA
jgi:release factor glutamine methyltransferase